jgi:hypothetical protein
MPFLHRSPVHIRDQISPNLHEEKAPQEPYVELAREAWEVFETGLLNVFGRSYNDV